jgi:uncharacterized NAD(P)/FAD-binding protein YdhS
VAREGDGFAIRLGHGSTLQAQTVVLALGNFPPGNLGVPGLTEYSQRYVRFPWSREALSGLSDSDSVLLIGSGLTSVDVALALQAKAFQGKIHVVSRHGLVPLAHRPAHSSPRFWGDQSPRTTRGLMRLVRNQVASVGAAGGGWRTIMDSLRPLVQEIWQSLPAKERRRFLRHARAYWDIHRHRVAPEIASTFSGMIETGQVQIRAGRVASYSETSEAAEVTLRPRGSETTECLRVTRVINCSGPETNCRKIDSPLLASVLAQGLVRQDELGLGLDSSANGALLDSNGHPSQHLYGIGPVRKGNLWETTAVPELRVQAADLAERLVDEHLRGEALNAFGSETFSASHLLGRTA